MNITLLTTLLNDFLTHNPCFFPSNYDWDTFWLNFYKNSSDPECLRVIELISHKNESIIDGVLFDDIIGTKKEKNVIEVIDIESDEDEFNGIKVIKIDDSDEGNEAKEEIDKDSDGDDEKYLGNLDEYQLDCVKQDFDVPLIISAPPGGGKTRTLLSRLWWMLKNGIDASSILCITFTKKAAAELQERLSSLLGKNSSQMNQMNIGTIHHICFKMILQYQGKLGYRRMGVANEYDQIRIVRDVLKIKDKKEIKEIVNKINYFKPNRDRLKIYGPSPYPKHLLYDKYITLYSKELKRRGLVDYNDMVMLANGLLDNPQILDRYRRKYKYIFVDEYQDTSSTQVQIIKKIVGGSGRITVVGDDDQSIYGFRGVSPDLFVNFKRSYPTHQHKILLNNYRSTKIITSAADELINNNKRLEKRKIISQRHQGIKIQSVVLQTSSDEALFVSKMIRKLINPSEQVTEFGGLEDFKDFPHIVKRYGDVAVLCRFNSGLTTLEQAFKRAQIPYVRFGSLSLYKREDVIDLLSHLRLIIDNNVSANNDFKRIVNKPKRQVTDRVLSSLNQLRKGSYYQNLCYLIRNPRIANSINIGNHVFGILKEFHTRIENLKKLFFTQRKSIEFILRYIVNETDYKIYRDQLIKNDRKRQAQQRRSRDEDDEDSAVHSDIETRSHNLICLCNDAKTFTPESDINPNAQPQRRMIEMFLSYTKVSKSYDIEDRKSVCLSTIHSSKGLEFKAVFIINAVEGCLPYIKCEEDENPEDKLNEERKVAYVALTRSKDITFFTGTVKSKFGSTNEKSRFILEMGEENVNEVYYGEGNIPQSSDSEDYLRDILMEDEDDDDYNYKKYNNTNYGYKRKRVTHQFDYGSYQPKPKKRKIVVKVDKSSEVYQLAKDGDLQSLSKNELKEYCRKFKLRVSGNKSDLDKRLTDHFKINDTASTTGANITSPIPTQQSYQYQRPLPNLQRQRNKGYNQPDTWNQRRNVMRNSYYTNPPRRNVMRQNNFPQSRIIQQNSNYGNQRHRNSNQNRTLQQTFNNIIPFDQQRRVGTNARFRKQPISQKRKNVKFKPL